MRVLVATTAGAGHFGPVVPFAAALRDAGHEAVVAAPASFAGAVERAGFVHRPFADADPQELAAVFAGLAGMSSDEGNAVVVRDVFGRIDARAALPGIRKLIDGWRPDLVLREASEYASYVTAEAAGIPHVQVAVGLAAFEQRFLPMLEGPLAELGSAAGVAGLRAAPCLSLAPESLEEPGPPRPEAIHRFRDGESTGAADPIPEWWDGPPAPLVYVTFGSVAATLGLFPSLYQQVVAALADQPVRVLLTLGEGGDPDLLRPLPANAHVERWWPQRHVMAHAAAMVGHGGFGTTLQGLVAGVPMVVVPLFADQPDNARRVEALGAGIVLRGGPGAVGRLAGAIERLLTDGSYRCQAEATAAEIAALPPVSDCVPLLEQLAGR